MELFAFELNKENVKIHFSIFFVWKTYFSNYHEFLLVNKFTRTERFIFRRFSNLFSLYACCHVAAVSTFKQFVGSVRMHTNFDSFHIAWLRSYARNYKWRIFRSVSFLSTILSLCGSLHGDDDFQHFHKHWIFHSFIFGGNRTQSDTSHTYTLFYRFYRVWQGTWICMTITCESAMSMFSVWMNYYLHVLFIYDNFFLDRVCIVRKENQRKCKQIQIWWEKTRKKLFRRFQSIAEVN